MQQHQHQPQQAQACLLVRDFYPGGGLWRPCCRASRRRGRGSVRARSAGSPFPAHSTWLRNGGADGPDSPFHVLRLAERGLANWGGAIHGRSYAGLSPAQQEVPDVASLFEDPTFPLLVDVGCGAGRFVLLAAHRLGQSGVPDCCASSSGHAGRPLNVLGVDQHKQLMQRGNVWAQAVGLQGRAAFLPVNVQSSATSLPRLLESYPGPLVMLTVQNPDPHYRTARHVVTPRFVADAAEALAPGGAVLLTSDVRDTARHMRAVFAQHGRGRFALHPRHSDASQLLPEDDQQQGTGDPYLPHRRPAQQAWQGDGAAMVCRAAAAGPQLLLEDPAAVESTAWDGTGWLRDNPLGADVPTEREVFARLVTKSPVYRVLLQRL